MSETATAKSPNTVGALMPVDVANDSITILEFHDGRMASYKNDGVIGLKTVHILKPIVIKGEEVYEDKPVTYSCVVIPKLDSGADNCGKKFRYPTFANEEMTRRVSSIAKTRTIQNFSLPGATPFMPDRISFCHDDQDYILEFTFKLKE